MDEFNGTFRAPNQSGLVGRIIPDRLKWDTHVRLGRFWVNFWIWDELKRFPEGSRVRITIEVLDEQAPSS